MLKKIEEYVTKNMEDVHDSRQPSEETVLLAWALCELQFYKEFIAGMAEKSATINSGRPNRITDIPDNCKCMVRISDNMLDYDDYPISIITLKHGVVTKQRDIIRETYSIPNMLKWEKLDLLRWAKEDEPGRAVETYYDLYIL